MQDNKVISPPPLTFSPIWARSLPLMYEDILKLQMKVQQALKDLSILSDTVDDRRHINRVLLSRKNKEPKLLEEVQNELGNMKCSVEQTKWLDTARTLADNAYESLSECFRATSNLSKSSPEISEDEFKQYITIIQECKEKAQRHCEQLNSHFNQLLKSLDEVEIKPVNKEANIRTYQSALQAKIHPIKGVSSSNKVALQEETSSPHPRLSYQEDIYVRYKAGLKKLIDQLKMNHPLIIDVLGYEAQLLENINAMKRGDNNTLQNDRSRIIGQLNQIALNELKKSFNELCDL